jgi:hypothetical protein
VAQRLSSILAEDTSASYSPTDDVVVQVDAPTPVTVDVEIKMDASLNWALAYSFSSYAEPVTRLTRVPFMRFKFRGNKAGNTVQIWDNL